MIRKIAFLFLLFPMMLLAQTDPSLQIEKSLQMKIAILKSFIEKGEKGEEGFWQTKGKITFGIVNYTTEQNPKFRDLFISQYKEILPVLQNIIATQDEKSSNAFVKILIRQEEDYRKMLTPEQLTAYRSKMTEMETKDPKLSESYASLFFSDALLKLYEAKF